MTSIVYFPSTLDKLTFHYDPRSIFGKLSYEINDVVHYYIMD